VCVRACVRACVSAHVRVQARPRAEGTPPLLPPPEQGRADPRGHADRKKAAHRPRPRLHEPPWTSGIPARVRPQPAAAERQCQTPAHLSPRRTRGACCRRPARGNTGRRAGQLPHPEQHAAEASAAGPRRALRSRTRQTRREAAAAGRSRAGTAGPGRRRFAPAAHAACSSKGLQSFKPFFETCKLGHSVCK
jgi:hypothetical protein